MIISTNCWIVFSVVVWIFARCLFLLICRIRNKKLIIKREIIINLFAIYILCLAGVTLFPIDIEAGQLAMYETPNVNFIPFRSVFGEIKDINLHHFMIKIVLENIFGNLALLMPLGIFLLILWKKSRNFKLYILIGFLTSLIIEIIQFIESYFRITLGRASDIDDIILNTLGIIVVYIVFKKNNFIHILRNFIVFKILI